MVTGLLAGKPAGLDWIFPEFLKHYIGKLKECFAVFNATSIINNSVDLKISKESL